MRRPQKLEKITHSVLSKNNVKKNERFFQILFPSHNIWTLISFENTSGWKYLLVRYFKNETTPLCSHWMDRAPEVKFEITWFGERVCSGNTGYRVFQRGTKSDIFFRWNKADLKVFFPVLYTVVL